MFDRAAIDELRADRGRLVAALEDAGAVVRGDSVKCPFHADTSASGSLHNREGAELFTCHGCNWNDGKATGDVVHVVQRFHKLDFPSTLKRLGLKPSLNSDGKHEANAPRPDALATALREADEAHQRLIASPDALDHLWQTRAVTREAVEQFKVGITDDPPGRRYWTFPVTDATGHFAGLKLHRADGQTSEPKGHWKPKGCKAADMLYPVHLDPDGPVYLAPGELKALAAASIGCATVSITGGESSNLPDSIITLLAGRAVGVIADADPAGVTWQANAIAQLERAGIEARPVDLGLADGEDFTDWATRRLIEDAKDADSVRATLGFCYEQSDPWRPYTLEGVWADPRTWTPAVHVPTGLRALDELAGGGLRTRAVHLFVGRPGKSKSQTSIQIATNAAMAGVSVAVFSLEMDRHEVSQLVLAQLARVPRSHIAVNKLSVSDRDRCDEIRAEYRTLPMVILDDDRWEGGLDRDRFASIVADGVKRFGWQLIVLDYLGLIAAGQHDRSDYQTDLLNSTALRRVARQHDAALLIIAALRKPMSQAKPADKITLYDVIGAGRLTYDSTTVWYVDSEQTQDSPPIGFVNLFPLKTRYTGAASAGSKVQLRWQPGYGRVENLLQGEE